MEHSVLGSKKLLAGCTLPVRLRLDNRFARFEEEPPLEVKNYFRFRMPGYVFSMKYRLGQWDGHIHLLRRRRVASGLFLYLRGRIEEETGIRFHVTDCRRSPTFHKQFPTSIASKIRDYQDCCVRQMVKSSDLGGLIRNATGTGKTFLAGAYFSLLKGSACFVVDELTLLEQAVRELRSTLGEKVGVIGDQVFRPERITVATVQTLHRHRDDPKFVKWSDRLQVMMVDEVHLALNRRNVDVINAICPKAVFGLTATLELKKPDVLMRAVALAGPPIFEYNIQTGVDQGFLSHGVICRVLVPAEGLYSNYQLEYKRLISHNKHRNDCIEALVRESLRRQRRVAVLVERLSHLRILSQRWKDLPHAVVCGAVSKEKRFQAKSAMDKGKLPLILATRVFSKGINIRTVDTIIDATAGKSHNSAIQRYGRGVRRADGKVGLIYFDMSDTSTGLPGGKKNRFAVSANSRLKALKTLSVSIISVRDVKDQVVSAYDTAERQLQETVKRV